MRDLFNLLKPLGSVRENSIEFTRSNPAYLPTITLTITNTAECKAVFIMSNAKRIATPINNVTGTTKKPSHPVKSYTIEQTKKRLKGLNLTVIDHAGFNLPWFMGGTHPLIGFLQASLKNKSLYHTFPSGEAWDFIIPATSDEIHGAAAIDYTQIRKPKFELVSHEKSSTPLIQLDIATNTTYPTLKERFPEGYHDDARQQTWVFITNPYNLAICLVLNEDSKGDWSEQFAQSRIQ
jgi:hypothetical protein